jgi:hypothetical protein
MSLNQELLVLGIGVSLSLREHKSWLLERLYKLQI